MADNKDTTKFPVKKRYTITNTAEDNTSYHIAKLTDKEYDTINKIFHALNSDTLPYLPYITIKPIQ